MPPIKQAPPRFCGWCGRELTRKRYNGRLEDFGVFQRRKFCDTACMSQDFDSRPVKKNPSRTVGHYHARKLVPKGPCENCGTADGRDIHHRNFDRNDNRRENLIRLCRGCHMRMHHWQEREKPTLIRGEGGRIAGTLPQRSTRAATLAGSEPNQESISSPEEAA